MVDRKEIAHLGDLVKVDLKDPEKYIKQVEEILNYFERLDKVEYDTDKTLRKEVPYDALRDDKHEKFSTDGKPLVDFLKKDKTDFIRAPKMI
ncbi:MAG TPA: hypothetical protein VJ792_02440 [Candidatus Nitrosotalea sp.]|nr:hypothetical protein [Candidatus Nitrosotalea sp.]